MATPLIHEIQEVMDENPLPEGWEADSRGRVGDDGYIFIRKGGVIIYCVVDIANHRRAASEGRGPITIELYAGNWIALCDADTPEQAVAALITFILTGNHDELRRI